MFRRSTRPGRQAQEQDVKGPDQGEEEDEDDGPQVAGEATSAMHDVLELHQSDVPELVSSLNTDQQRGYEMVDASGRARVRLLPVLRPETTAHVCKRCRRHWQIVPEQDRRCPCVRIVG